MSWLTRLNAPEESTRLDVRHKAHLEPWSEGQVVVTTRPSGGYEALVTPRFSAKDGLICAAALMMMCLFMMGEEGLLTLWIAGELSEMSSDDMAWSMLCVVGALGAIGWLLYRNFTRHLLICTPELLRVEHLAPWRPAHTLYEGGYNGVNLFRDVHVTYSEHGGTSRTAYFILKLPSEVCSQVQFDTDATAREMEAVQHVIEHMRAHSVGASAPSRRGPSAAVATAALVATRGGGVAAYERLRGESPVRRLTAVATMIAFEGHQGAMPGAARRVTFGELSWRSVFAPVRSGAHRCSASIDALHRLLIEDLSQKQRALISLSASGYCVITRSASQAGISSADRQGEHFATRSWESEAAPGESFEAFHERAVAERLTPRGETPLAFDSPELLNEAASRYIAYRPMTQHALDLGIFLSAVAAACAMAYLLGSAMA